MEGERRSYHDCSAFSSLYCMPLDFSCPDLWVGQEDYPRSISRHKILALQVSSYGRQKVMCVWFSQVVIIHHCSCVTPVCTIVQSALLQILNLLPLLTHSLPPPPHSCSQKLVMALLIGGQVATQLPLPCAYSLFWPIWSTEQQAVFKAVTDLGWETPTSLTCLRLSKSKIECRNVKYKGWEVRGKWKVIGT